MEAIKTENLTKYYGKNRGIMDLNMSVEQGEVFGFIGPNGAGKSTTVRTLLGLIRPTSGNAAVLGCDILRDRENLLAQVGYMAAEASFYPGMRVRDVLKLSAELRRRDCRQNAEQLCERLQLDTNRRVDELSLGNRKKVSIICAMQHSPRLLILDEPTSGLDPLMQRAFFDILHERNEAGTTIFLSSHVLSEIQRHCHRAAMICEGRIIRCDTVEALSGTQVKRVSLRGNVDVHMLSGVQAMHTADGAVHFLYTGSLDALLSLLAHGHIQDLSITEPDLEETFLHNYVQGGDAS